MTIRRGEDWGTAGPMAPEAVIAATDEALREAIAAGRSEAGLTGGDLARTVGSRASAAELRDAGDRMRLPIDVVDALLDDAPTVFVAHLVVRRPLWSGPVTAVMNAAFVGDWNLAPRAHPNDGRLDVVSFSLSLPDRVKARARVRSGTHVPHPSISMTRETEGTIEVPTGATVWVDGSPARSVSCVRFRIRPDAFTVVI